MSQTDSDPDERPGDPDGPPADRSPKVGITDTSPEAERIRTETYRRMTGEERLLLALEMSEFARELAKSRLRAEHPDWTEWELKRELLRYAFGSQPLPPPLR
ncbi:MAG TPA: hypothetical protein VHG08_07260 [Longimicrobium sp.]|nr:hypothetical protein [Longimicrobium sp.]